MLENEKVKIIKVPKFTRENGFQTTPERSALMSKIKGKNTKSEVTLRKALWTVGLRYRLHVKNLPGSPDIVFNKYKLVIFVDGEFWHGFNWVQKQNDIKKNKEFWYAKIERNMQRDKDNMEKLESLGYTVLRFWEKQIKKHLEICVGTVIEQIESK